MHRKLGPGANIQKPSQSQPHLVSNDKFHASGSLAFHKEPGLKFENRHHLACIDVAPVLGLLITSEPALVGFGRQFFHAGRFSSVWLDLNDVCRRLSRETRMGGIEHPFEAGECVHDI